MSCHACQLLRLWPRDSKVTAGRVWDQRHSRHSATEATEVMRGLDCKLVRLLQVGCIGFCMGGALSFLAAMQAPIDAAVAFYGRPEGGDVSGSTLPPAASRPCH